MKLYKFRSFENIEFTLDIIMNERLYCAQHNNLNDPFEGLFSTREWKGGISRPVVRSVIRPVIRSVIRDGKQTVYKTLDELPSMGNNTRVCSFSSSMVDVRMWSLYAASHSGCVIEIELDESEELVEVRYEKGLIQFKEKLTENTTAIDILSFKTDHWQHEKEFRIISSEEYFSVKGKITGIFLGVRTQDIHKDIVVRSTPIDIPIYNTKIDEDRVEIRPNKRVN